MTEDAVYDAIWLPLPFLPKAIVPAAIAASVRAQPVVLPNRLEVAVLVSVGVAWSTGDALDADALVARGDQAMYESKRERAGLPKLALAA